MIRQCLILGLLHSVFAAYVHHNEEWSYHGPNGPSQWATLFPDYCAGNEQSPINIEPFKATYSTAGPLALTGYRKIDTPENAQMDFINNGHTVEVLLTSGDYHIRGGPLKATYQAAQFHFHWGSSDVTGSEHTISGKHRPAEMHIVHWDRDNYKSIDEAIQHKNGIAVLGVFLEVGDTNPTFDNLANAMDKVQYKDDRYTFPSVFPIAGLMPDSEDLKNYYHYEGSLTTPHCNEVVQWILYREPIEVSAAQLASLRSVFKNIKGDGLDTPLVDNFRPTQSLKNRPIYITGENPLKLL